MALALQKFKTLLPPNATPLEAAVERATWSSTNIEAAIDRLWSVGGTWRAGVGGDVDACPADYLPYLASAVGVDIWRSEWSEQEKRDMIRRYVNLRRIRGTIKALREIFDILGVNVTVREWWQGDGETANVTPATPYYFELRLYVRSNPEMITEQARDIMVRMVDAFKPLRAAYNLHIIYTMDQNLGASSLLRISKIARLGGGFRHA